MINMKGTVITSSLETLKKVEGSKLALMCEQEQIKLTKSMFIDREAGPFMELLAYLQTDQSYLPNVPTSLEKKLIEDEFKFWEITNLDYELATSNNFL